MERIRTVPMTKQTYQPKKRHRAKEHGFRARMKTTPGRRVLAAGALAVANGSRPDGSSRHARAAARDALPSKGVRGVRGRRDHQVQSLLTARFLRTDLGKTRFGLATGRKLGTAVVRNRVRRLRGALRVMAPSFQPGWDVLIIARPAIVEADHDALVGALRRTLVRGGVLGGPSAT